jgi:hypothetical protein
VAGDVYPYNAGSTKLDNMMPAWAHDGGTAKLLERLADKATRRRLVEECLIDGERWGTVSQGGIGFDQVFIATCARREIEGLSLAQIATWTAGKFLCERTSPEGIASGYSIDTRTLEQGDLFFAIHGERFDGHNFLDAAFQRGGRPLGDARPVWTRRLEPAEFPARIQSEPPRCRAPGYSWQSARGEAPHL